MKQADQGVSSKSRQVVRVKSHEDTAEQILDVHVLRMTAQFVELPSPQTVREMSRWPNIFLLLGGFLNRSCTSREFVEPQSFSLSQKACIWFYKYARRDEVRRLTRESASGNEKKDDTTYLRICKIRTHPL